MALQYRRMSYIVLLQKYKYLKVMLSENYYLRNCIHINDIIVGFVTSGFAISVCGFLMSILSHTMICPCVNVNVTNACGFLCLYFPVSVYTTINNITILYYVGCLVFLQLK